MPILRIDLYVVLSFERGGGPVQSTTGRPFGGSSRRPPGVPSLMNLEQ
jgi:hypothetical protein